MEFSAISSCYSATPREREARLHRIANLRVQIPTCYPPTDPSSSENGGTTETVSFCADEVDTGSLDECAIGLFTFK